MYLLEDISILSRVWVRGNRDVRSLRYIYISVIYSYKLFQSTIEYVWYVLELRG